jgi:hypothetical protein
MEGGSIRRAPAAMEKQGAAGVGGGGAFIFYPMQK